MDEALEAVAEPVVEALLKAVWLVRDAVTPLALTQTPGTDDADPLTKLTAAH